MILSSPENNSDLFVQFFDPVSSTYTYLLADINDKEAILIDPVIEWADRDKTIVEELGLKLKYARELNQPSVDHYLACKFRGL